MSEGCGDVTTKLRRRATGAASTVPGVHHPRRGPGRARRRRGRRPAVRPPMTYGRVDDTLYLAQSAGCSAPRAGRRVRDRDPARRAGPRARRHAPLDELPLRRALRTGRARRRRGGGAAFGAVVEHSVTGRSGHAPPTTSSSEDPGAARPRRRGVGEGAGGRPSTTPRTSAAGLGRGDPRVAGAGRAGGGPGGRA